MAENNSSNITEGKVAKKIILKTGKRLLLLICIIITIGILLVASLMIIFKNDTGDSAFKDNKKDWEEVTKDFKTD